MRVKQLKKVLATMDDECLIVVSGSDHSYREANASDETAGMNNENEIFKWFGMKHASPGERLIRVVVIE